MAGKKIWCLLGVHQYATVEKGPYEKTVGGHVSSRGCYYILRCNVCGQVRRRIMA